MDFLHKLLVLYLALRSQCRCPLLFFITRTIPFLLPFWSSPHVLVVPYTPIKEFFIAPTITFNIHWVSLCLYKVSFLYISIYIRLCFTFVRHLQKVRKRWRTLFSSYILYYKKFNSVKFVVEKTEKLKKRWRTLFRPTLCSRKI